CGATGCLETLASVTAVTRRARELGLPVELPELVEVAGPEHPVWEGLVFGLGHGLRTFANVLGPDAIALVGGLTVARPALDAAVRAFRREVIPVHRDLPVHVLGRADRFAILGC
ncbi:MAG: ROK family protein, partial [Myxococcales bacterium]|nr:ROK family protein [Myxococcales bacterium]